LVASPATPCSKTSRSAAMSMANNSEGGSGFCRCFAAETHAVRLYRGAQKGWGIFSLAEKNTPPVAISRNICKFTRARSAKYVTR
jgi:hypothetical protein